jgi:hypothetical protein
MSKTFHKEDNRSLIRKPDLTPKKSPEKDK